MDNELWSAEGDHGIERFSLDVDGLLYSDHVGCGVRLDVKQLVALSAAAFAAAERLRGEA